MLKTINALTLALAFCGLAHADFDVVGDGQYVLPTAYEPSDVAIQQAKPLSCKEARNTAWFIAELSRTDGNVQPEVAFTPCGPEMLARSTADAD